mmetsp:Transcript_3241/g.4475  ORF Transcript_3241/g.4475 Transcript_3241/m.4475 type:complete len:80 (-) Transcript_3241:797-1036(-)
MLLEKHIIQNISFVLIAICLFKMVFLSSMKEVPIVKKIMQTSFFQDAQIANYQFQTNVLVQQIRNITQIISLVLVVARI